MTRSHNIVADGWAGASNPMPPTNTPTQKRHLKRSFFPSRTNRPTDRLTKPLMELRLRNETEANPPLDLANKTFCIADSFVHPTPYIVYCHDSQSFIIVCKRQEPIKRRFIEVFYSNYSFKKDNYANVHHLSYNYR